MLKPLIPILKFGVSCYPFQRAHDSVCITDGLLWPACGHPRGCSSFQCPQRFGGWAAGQPKSSGRLVCLGHIDQYLIPALQIPLSLWPSSKPCSQLSLLWTARNVCAQLSGKQKEPARSVMLGDIGSCSEFLNVHHVQGSGCMSQENILYSTAIQYNSCTKLSLFSGGLMGFIMYPPQSQAQYYIHQLQPSKSLS